MYTVCTLYVFYRLYILTLFNHFLNRLAENVKKCYQADLTVPDRGSYFNNNPKCELKVSVSMSSIYDV